MSQHKCYARQRIIENTYAQLLRDKGNAQARLPRKLKAEGRSVREIERAASLDAMTEATHQAMREGIAVIYQGALRSGQWHGYSDFLQRVDAASDLGAYSYEVADTKLGRTAKPKHVVQLCVYSDLVAREQGLRPKYAHALKIVERQFRSTRLFSANFKFGRTKNKLSWFGAPSYRSDTSSATVSLEYSCDTKGRFAGQSRVLKRRFVPWKRSVVFQRATVPLTLSPTGNPRPAGTLVD
jgi:hypothetical protein